MRRIKPMIIPYTVIGVTGLLIFGDALQTMTRAQLTRNWSLSRGQILQSEIEVRGNGRHFCALAKIVYAYPTPAGPKTGVRVRFRDGCLTAWEQTAFAKTYIAGINAPVYFDPERSSEALLMPGSTSFDWWVQALLGITFAAIGFTCWMREYRALRGRFSLR